MKLPEMLSGFNLNQRCFMMRTLFIIGHNEKVSRSKTVDDDGGNDRDGVIVIRVRTNSILGYHLQHLVMLDIHNDRSETGTGEKLPTTLLLHGQISADND